MSTLLSIQQEVVRLVVILITCCYTFHKLQHGLVVFLRFVEVVIYIEGVWHPCVRFKGNRNAEPVRTNNIEHLTRRLTRYFSMLRHKHSLHPSKGPSQRLESLFLSFYSAYKLFTRRIVRALTCRW